MTPAKNIYGQKILSFNADRYLCRVDKSKCDLLKACKYCFSHVFMPTYSAFIILKEYRLRFFFFFFFSPREQSLQNLCFIERTRKTLLKQQVRLKGSRADAWDIWWCSFKVWFSPLFVFNHMLPIYSVHMRLTSATIRRAIRHHHTNKPIKQKLCMKYQIYWHAMIIIRKQWKNRFINKIERKGDTHPSFNYCLLLFHWLRGRKKEMFYNFSFCCY